VPGLLKLEIRAHRAHHSLTIAVVNAQKIKETHVFSPNGRVERRACIGEKLCIS
jgi:hypothetical protein